MSLFSFWKRGVEVKPPIDPEDIPGTYIGSEEPSHVFSCYLSVSIEGLVADMNNRAIDGRTTFKIMQAPLVDKDSGRTFNGYIAWYKKNDR